MSTLTSLTALAHQIVRGADSLRDAAAALGLDLTAPCLDPAFEFGANVARGNLQRLVLSSHPIAGKTTSVELVCAWLMYVRPGFRIILSSCAEFLAEVISQRVQSLLVNLFGVSVSRDRRAAGYWVAANGSSMRAVGVGTSLVGIHCELLVCDDLIPSMAAAMSDAERTRLEMYFRSSALDRLVPGASVIVLMHRWHTQDLAGQLVGEGWDWVNIAATDPITGEPAWPSKWSRDELDRKRREVGEIVWAAKWQGNPRPLGGSVFAAPPVYFDPAWMRAALTARSARIIIACDPAASARTRADYSVVLVGAVTQHVEQLGPDPKPSYNVAAGSWLRPRREPIRHVRSQLSVIEGWRGQVEIPDLVDRLVTMQRAWGAAVGVESVAGFKSVASYLRRANPALSVFELRATTDKYTRAIPAAASWARGDIQLRPNADFLRWFVPEVASFTGTGADQHDDAPDCLVHLWSMVHAAEHLERTERRRRMLAQSLPFG